MMTSAYGLSKLSKHIKDIPTLSVKDLWRQPAPLSTSAPALEPLVDLNIEQPLSPHALQVQDEAKQATLQVKQLHRPVQVPAWAFIISASLFLPANVDAGVIATDRLSYGTGSSCYASTSIASEKLVWSCHPTSVPPPRLQKLHCTFTAHTGCLCCRA